MITRKTTIKNIKKIVILLLLLPLLSSAETLYIEPDESEHRPDNQFIKEIRVETEECINAADVQLFYPVRNLTAVEFIDGNSVFSMWPKQPEIDEEEGKISFSGGSPGGYCPEDGESILLGEVLFKANHLHSEATDRIRFWTGSEVLLNDGQATSLDLSYKSSSVTINPDSEEEKDEWRDRIEKDEDGPSILDIQLQRIQLPSSLREKLILFITAKDAGSGIDRFEILEQRRVGFLAAESADWNLWDRSENPYYVLEDQSGRSIVRIRAVDKAGNETVKTVYPSPGWQDLIPWSLFILVLILLLWSKLINKKRPLEEERPQVNF